MRISTVLGAAALAAVLGTGKAPASGFAAPEAPDTAQHDAIGLGRTLPPIGFVNFCARNPADCRATGRSASRIPMSGERWRLVYQLNSYVNGRVQPVSDADLYGQAEYWAYPAGAGDCEDYVLMKKRYLEMLGFARSALLITVVLDEKNEGHAALTLRTEEGDFVLDNRHNEIRRWKDLDYVYLKRQSERDPREWVALSDGDLAASAMLAGGPAR